MGRVLFHVSLSDKTNETLREFPEPIESIQTVVVDSITMTIVATVENGRRALWWLARPENAIANDVGELWSLFGYGVIYMRNGMAEAYDIQIAVTVALAKTPDGRQAFMWQPGYYVSGQVGKKPPASYSLRYDDEAMYLEWT